MKITTLGAAAGFAILPAIMLAQTPTPPPAGDTTTTTSPMRDSSATGVNVSTPTIQNTTGTSVGGVNLNNTPANPTTGTNSGTTNSGTSTGTNATTGNMGNDAAVTGSPVTGSMTTTSMTMPMSSGSAMISSNGAMPATGSAFAMGTHSAARDSLIGPRPEPPGDGTACPWGCPTSSGVAGLTGPQFLALQQELRDRKCGLSHVTGRLDAATRSAIRSCANKMGVANTAAAVLAGFDIGFSSSDISASGNVREEEE